MKKQKRSPKAAKELVSNLLQTVLSSRHGCRKDGALEIKHSPQVSAPHTALRARRASAHFLDSLYRYFATIDFEALVAGKIKPPWIPKLKSKRDCLALHISH